MRPGDEADLDLLFVIGPTEGGAFASTEELCHQLVDRGLRVEILHESAEAPARRYMYRRLTNLEVKLNRPPMLEGGNRMVGRRVRSSGITARVPLWETTILENGARRFLSRRRPRVIVASALSRVGWRRLRQDASAFGIPLVFYMRGQTMVPHLELGAEPDLIVVNSHALQEAVENLGRVATTVLSVIDLARYRVETSRKVALVINPIPAYGQGLALQVAQLTPNIQFEFRESHSVSATGHRTLASAVAELPNVTLLPTTSSTAELYGRARVLIVPYPARDLLTNRPRIVSEAQINGIPVVGSDIPGLRHSIGTGGRLLDAGAPEQWAAELDRLWADGEYYEQLSARARNHAERPELDPAHITDGFLAALAPILTKEWPR